MNKLVWKTSLILALAALVLGATPAVQAAPASDPGINRIYLTTVRDVSCIVSWTTNLPSDGKVEWGLTAALGSTAADSVTNTTTHFVQLTGLAPATTYYYRVVSGTAARDNGGVPFQVTTGSTLGLLTPGKVVRGHMYAADGTTAVPNAIVYLQVQDGDGAGSGGSSQWFSARTSASGAWSFDLVNGRTADLSAYFTFSSGTDQLRIVGQGGAAGTKGADPDVWLIPAPGAYPYNQNIILDDEPTAVRLTGFTAAAAPQGKWAAAAAGALLLAGLGWLIRRRLARTPA